MNAVQFCTIAAVVIGAYVLRNDLPPFHASDAIGLAFIALLLVWMFRKRSVGSGDPTDS